MHCQKSQLSIGDRANPLGEPIATGFTFLSGKSFKQGLAAQ